MRVTRATSSSRLVATELNSARADIPIPSWSRCPSAVPPVGASIRARLSSGSRPGRRPGPRPPAPRVAPPGSRPGVLTRLDLRGARPTAGLLPAPGHRRRRAGRSPHRRCGPSSTGCASRVIWPLGSSPGSSTASPSTVCASPPSEVTAALADIPTELRTALQVAHDNIVAYHRTQLHHDTRQDRDGIVVRDLTIPVDRAGLYVPGDAPLWPPRCS